MNTRQKDNLTDAVEDLARVQNNPQNSQSQDNQNEQRVVNDEGESITLGNDGSENRAI